MWHETERFGHICLFEIINNISQVANDELYLMSHEIDLGDAPEVIANADKPSPQINQPSLGENLHALRAEEDAVRKAEQEAAAKGNAEADEADEPVVTPRPSSSDKVPPRPAQRKSLVPKEAADNEAEPVAPLPGTCCTFGLAPLSFK